jgi:hypothetical protein
MQQDAEIQRNLCIIVKAHKSHWWNENNVIEMSVGGFPSKPQFHLINIYSFFYF